MPCPSCELHVAGSTKFLASGRFVPDGRLVNEEPDDEAVNERVSIEELSARSGPSSGLIRLAVDCGCSTEGGKLSQVGFVEWLTDNYALVREQAGLPALLLTLGANRQQEAHEQVGNSLQTIADYHASRMVSLDHQEDWRALGQTIGDHTRRLGGNEEEPG